MGIETPLPQLWGGVEATINRVGDVFFDQYARSGHRKRVHEDLQQIATLGVTALRVGLQWEHFAATGSWADFDRLLSAMQEFGLRPIAGLLHHGSGPPETNLLDPGFPEKLAAYARSVAERYPWVLDYTPVNEPQTTSRFSCLYGHWYPHHQSLDSYAQALVLELKGVVLAMREIRSVQPEARLIHTEDGGATFATPQLEAMRQEREHRRWLGTDLLCGRVSAEHPMFAFLVRHGVAPEAVLWFGENPCPPSVLGLNYYLTSDRYLDHRTELYPPGFAGGDTGKEPFVDVEALRVRSEGLSGVEAILTEAWERYRLPVAITEAHLGGTSDDQVRWLAEVWEQAQAAQRRGVTVQAVTVWALLGLWNWSNLCTRDLNSYEPGVFDAGNGELKPTALVDAMRRMAQGKSPRPETFAEPAWWERPERLTFAPFEPTVAREAELMGA